MTTKREILRREFQKNTLLQVGFTEEEANALRRISMTLHRWSEHCCNGNIQREGPRGDGKPRWYYGQSSDPKHSYPISDRERGALRRLAKIIDARNARYPSKALGCNFEVTPYVQTDPRGCALYILRPGDVPEGKSVDAYYSRGIAVY